MVNWEERVKLTNTQLNKFKVCSKKNKTGTILRLNKKKYEDEELPHKLFLTTRQITKIRNPFANNMSTDIRLSQAQISKIIQSGGFLGKTLGKLSKKVLLDFAVPKAKDVLPKLATKATSSVLDKFEKEKNWARKSKSRKMFHFIYLSWRYEWCY